MKKDGREEAVQHKASISEEDWKMRKRFLLQVFMGIKKRFKAVIMGVRNHFLNGDNVWRFLLNMI